MSMWVVQMVQVLSRAADVLGMNGVRGMRGVGVVCEMYLARAV